MMRMRPSFPTMQEEVVHLSGVLDDGYILRWNGMKSPPFEIFCKNITPLQLKNIDNLLTVAYQQAVQTLLPDD